MSEETSTNWVNNDGTYGDLASAPEEVREVITKKDFKDVPSTLKAYQELESFLGPREKIALIPDKGDIEGLNKVMSRLDKDDILTSMGRPITPEEYNINPKEKYPDIADQIDSDLLSHFKMVSHQLGLTQTQAEAIVDLQIQAALAGQEEQEKIMQQEMEEAQSAIRGRFKSEEEYNQFTQKAWKFAEQFKLDGQTSVADIIEQKGLAHDPAVLDMLVALSDKTVESPLPHGGTSISRTREDRLKDIKANPAFVDKMHPEHKALMAEYHQVIFNKEG